MIMLMSQDQAFIHNLWFAATLLLAIAGIGIGGLGLFLWIERKFYAVAVPLVVIGLVIFLVAVSIFSAYFPSAGVSSS